MTQKENSIRLRRWQVHPLFEKSYLTCDQDDEYEEEQSRTRRRSTLAKRVIRRRPAALQARRELRT
jgi:hypothetical protein